MRDDDDGSWLRPLGEFLVLSIVWGLLTALLAASLGCTTPRAKQSSTLRAEDGMAWCVGVRFKDLEGLEHHGAVCVDSYDLCVNGRELAVSKTPRGGTLLEIGECAEGPIPPQEK